VVEIAKLREFMRTQAEEDRKSRWVQVEGEDLDEALRQAAIELSLPIKQIEYEIREPGKKGTFGVGRKNCVIVAYPAIDPAQLQLTEDSFELGEGEQAGETVDQNGDAIVRLFPEGVFLKVTPPVGNGNRAAEKQVYAQLKERDIERYDKQMIQKTIKSADNRYVKIGDFDYNPANDSIITVDITDFDMKAFIICKPPTGGGADPNFDGLVGFLKTNGVVFGIKEDALRNFMDYPKYNETVLVAEGTSPVNGNDARIIYNFETDRSKIKLKEKNGRVDFKESNVIQNVVEGQALGKKIPPDEGQPGRTVTGKLLPAKDGEDVKFELGKNVSLSDDGMTALASINGQVMLSNNKISVEPVYVVPGDVNLKTGGNVIFLGTVIVKGNVEDGFKVKAAGNIEIMGNVGKSELDAEGDVIVHQGITGKGEGLVRAGRGVWSKFIENAKIDSGDLVVASDGIINSYVNANQRIICQGKRATIVGGHLRAAEEIHAKTLGSVAGSETILDVGFDPKSKERLYELNTRVEEINEGLDKIMQDMATIKKLKEKSSKELPKEKLAYLKEITEKKNSLEEEKQEKQEEVEELQHYLSSLKVKGRISASERVFSGVKLSIKEASLEVRNEYKSVTFVNEKDDIKVTKYIKPEEDYSRPNNAASTD
jgi:uncharacterized protein